MNYLLDTSVIIGILRGKAEAENFIADHIDDNFSTSCICEAEIAEGIYREKQENTP